MRRRSSCTANCTRELAAVGRLDDEARELVDRDTEIFDLLDVEAEPARDARRGESHDADELERGGNREPDDLAGHRRFHLDRLSLACELVSTAVMSISSRATSAANQADARVPRVSPGDEAAGK